MSRQEKEVTSGVRWLGEFDCAVGLMVYDPPLLEAFECDSNLFFVDAVPEKLFLAGWASLKSEVGDISPPVA